MDEELIGLERAGWEALSAGGDAAASFYQDVLASKVLMLLPGGLRLDDREEVINSMRGAPWDSFDLSDEQVLRLGREGAVLVLSGFSEAWRPGIPGAGQQHVRA
jgi:hypothetical protein